MYDLVVCGKVYLDGQFEQCEIGIDNGRITAIKKAIECHNRIDLAHGVIVPGGIDSHVHFRCPGRGHKGDFSTGGMSAACGGITTVCDMPNTNPPTVNLGGLDQKLKAAEDCPVDFSLYAGFSKGQEISDLEAIVSKCIGFKLYMASTTGSLLIESDQGAEKALLMASHWSKPVWVHAEDQYVIDSRPKEAKDIQGHLRMRPPEAEARAIGRILAFNQGKGLHIAHVTTGVGLELVKPSEATCEVTPHHLILDVKNEGDAFLKVNPPLREEAEKPRLWEGLRSGDIDILASDHAPHTKDEKEQEFEFAPSGMPGVETIYPIMMHYAKKGFVTYERLVESISVKPAEILGMSDRGVIEEGTQADLVIFDLHQETKIKAENLHYKCGWTPYEGMEAIFPQMVISKGEIIAKDCNFEGRKGDGSLVC
jgi:dihydroorotase